MHINVERLCWPATSPLGLHERRARRPRGERQHSGARCSIIEGSIAAPTAPTPPPLTLAAAATTTAALERLSPSWSRPSELSSNSSPGSLSQRGNRD